MKTIQQAKVITKKNFRLFRRDKKEIFREFFIPAICFTFIVAGKSLQGLAFQLPIFLPASITGLIRRLIIDLVYEKSEKFKESQKIMGLQQSAYLLGWMTYAYIIGVFIATFMVVGLIITGIDSIGLIIVMFALYLFGALHFCLCITTFFSNYKLAGEIGTLLVAIAPALFYLIMFQEDVRNTKIAYWLLAIFPQLALTLGVFPKYYENVSEAQFLPQMAIVQQNFSATDAIIMLIVDLVFYFLLYCYLDSIFPNEYGIQKHPLFCIKNLFKKRQNVSESKLRSLSDGNNIHETFNSEQLQQGLDQGEDISSAIYHEKLAQNVFEKCKSTIKIRALKKEFKGFKAVNKISLNIYESQIFCLLGHNGAGKTTTINLMTGMIEKSGGEVEIYGNPLSEIDEIRSSLGVCGQKDILYDKLTIEEHLEFIGQIKLIPLPQLKQEINELINLCGLQQEYKKQAGQLSGGNKRKLSLAMALIGNAQVILLDEPTSGLDPISRRFIWDILKKIKSQNKTILLTTHHLDEADYLSDRIAIMAKGKLLILGSSEFIKRNFGVGYKLTLSAHQNSIPQFQQMADHLGEIVQAVIPSAQKNPQAAPDVRVHLLPFSTQNSFTPLFKELEAQQQSSNIFDINLEINTLEDTFINIGLDEDRFLQKKHKDEEYSKYINLQETDIPECLYEDPKYNFTVQCFAMFQRKYLQSYRNFLEIVMFLLPAVFMVIGAVVSVAIGNQDGDEQQTAENKQSAFYLIGLFVVLAYGYNCSIYITVVVSEREKKIKDALNTMGCKIWPYWIGSFLFDYFMLILTFVIFIIVSEAMNATFITENLGKMTALIACFGFSFIFQAYVLSFLFKTASSAAKLYILIQIFIFYFLPFLLVVVLRHTEVLNKVIQIIFFIISPLFTLNQAFYNISISPFRDFIPNDKLLFKFPLISQLYVFCLILIGQFVFYGILLYFVDLYKYNLKEFRSYTPKQNTQPLIESDADVDNEEKRIQQPTEDPIKALKLQKVYSNGYYALHNLHFGVEKGSILGLLGPNGAGKSTTFNIIASSIPKTSGKVCLHQTEVTSGFMDVYSQVAICPQYDCLWPFLTPYEHLCIFGRLKGLSGNKLKQQVEYYLKTMQLNDYRKKASDKLSGGNKRKLCVSNALIGGPNLQFFDEPSTGLDPIARRFLWNTLQQSMKVKQSSIVLTTHSMNEAEQLATKIGILINGKFACFGSNQHLKQIYGDGYRLTLQVQESNLNEVQNLFRQQYQNVKAIPSEMEGKLIYQFSSNGFSFYQTFSFLETLKQKDLIQDFSIAQCSLEQIFLHFSKFQKTEFI